MEWNPKNGPTLSKLTKVNSYVDLLLRTTFRQQNYALLQYKYLLSIGRTIWQGIQKITASDPNFSHQFHRNVLQIAACRLDAIKRDERMDRQASVVWILQAYT